MKHKKGYRIPPQTESSSAPSNRIIQLEYALRIALENESKALDRIAELEAQLDAVRTNHFHWFNHLSDYIAKQLEAGDGCQGI